MNSNDQWGQARLPDLELISLERAMACESLTISEYTAHLQNLSGREGGLAPASFPSTNFDHSLDRPSGANAYVFGNLDLILQLLQRDECVFQGNLIHVGATDASETKHFFVRICGGNVFTHRAFGQQQVTRRFGLLDVSDHRVGAGGII